MEVTPESVLDVPCGDRTATKNGVSADRTVTALPPVGCALEAPVAEFDLGFGHDVDAHPVLL